MTMRIRLSEKNYATIVSAYAPTMTYPDEEKERFYESLKATIGRVPRSDKQGWGRLQKPDYDYSAHKIIDYDYSGDWKGDYDYNHPITITVTCLPWKRF